jgi:hypothetical protein
MMVAPGKVGWRGSHQRWLTVVGWRKWPGVVVLQGGGGAPVAGESVDEYYSWRRGWGGGEARSKRGG